MCGRQAYAVYSVSRRLLALLHPLKQQYDLPVHLRDSDPEPVINQPKKLTSRIKADVPVMSCPLHLPVSPYAFCIFGDFFMLLFPTSAR